MGHTLRAHVLGHFELEGVDLAGLGSRKARSALKLLVVRHSFTVSSDTLIDAVWGERLPSAPYAQLKVLISRLRAAIGSEHIQTVPGGYRLDLEWLDRDELLTHTAAATRAIDARDFTRAQKETDAALAVARGRLLPEDDEAAWLEGERAAVDRALGGARALAAQSALELGGAAVAIRLAQEALDLDPYDEGSLRTLMRASLVLGRTAAGLHAYGNTRAFLAEELGVDPSAATEAVYLELIAEEPAGPAPVEFAISRSESLIGRDDVLLLLARQWEGSSGQCVIVNVEGEAGIGKSSVLAAFAAQLPDAVVWSVKCVETGRALPLQGLLGILETQLTRLGPTAATRLLGPERAVLASLLPGSVAPARTSWRRDVGSEETAFYNAYVAVVNKIAATTPLLIVLDDFHLAGSSTVALIDQLSTRAANLMVLTAARPGLGRRARASMTITLQPFNLDEVARLVGARRAQDLLVKSHGNPLIITQLAAQPTPAETLIDALRYQLHRLGDGAAIIIAAAVLGEVIDVELLATITGAAPLTVLGHLEAAGVAGIVDETAIGFAFRHSLVRDAIADEATSQRAALVHREAARALGRRPEIDSLAIALHARLGGDVALAATALQQAAHLALSGFDRHRAEELLGRAVELHDTGSVRLERARLFTTSGNYVAALQDVEAALTFGTSAEALEIGAWTSYFARDFERARQFADDGALLADNTAVRASCRIIGGRVRHANGDLASAEQLLMEAAQEAEGSSRALARVWLGVIRSHQSRFDEALELLRAITVVEAGPLHSTELLHALMFTGHALALAFRPLEALAVFDRYDYEVERRQIPRFLGRGRNFSGWVRRALGDFEGADALNSMALDQLGDLDFPETRISAHLDVAEGALLTGDGATARTRLQWAKDAFTGNLTFAWRLQLKMQMVTARLALGSNELRSNELPAALHLAQSIGAEATALGVPRYAIPARLLCHRAAYRLGLPIDGEALSKDVHSLDRACGIDAWWITAETARDLNDPELMELAQHRATELSMRAGAFASTLLAAFDSLAKR